MQGVRSHSGFTLLEVLLAIGITALIGVSTYTLLSQTLRTRDHLSVQAEELRRFQLAATIIQHDIRQISDRVIRDQFGDYQPALRLGGYSNYGALEFTKSGVANMRRQEISNFQRVSYHLRDDRLTRFVWPVLDQAPDSTPREQELLEGIAEIEVKVLDDKEWKAEWLPNPANMSPQDLKQLPEAISIEITTDTGEVYRWVEQVLRK
ncbi:type II secretion system minor pseudopilin GspJ [Litoribrevibacter albus]|uniref:Type II secretion system protein J n=1 Tax=Litoribrevibacter albus TaxID=1473156 RepID=A0AA37SB40_9GAMM|nr:type II secretion system minor pseudopilin GspJ [Litoribrevibacter albus]GLQ31835.1 type II secretion system protein J [Litoribrevibacter albus]